MKVKKLCNRSQATEQIVDNSTDGQKNGSNSGSTEDDLSLNDFNLNTTDGSGVEVGGDLLMNDHNLIPQTSHNHHISDSSVDNGLIPKVPTLSLIPEFKSSLKSIPSSDSITNLLTLLPKKFALLQIPVFTDFEVTNHSNIDSNNSLNNETIPNLVERNVFEVNDSISPEIPVLPPEVLDLGEVLEALGEFVDDNNLAIDSQFVCNSGSIHLNYSQTSCSTTDSTHLTINSSNAFVNNQNNIPTNVSINRVVDINLSDDTNSLRSSNESPLQSTSIEKNSVTNTLLNTNSSGGRVNRINKRIRIHIKPINYCVRNYRVFNYSRHSARNKSNTQDNDYEYEVLAANLSIAELDGSAFTFSVSKGEDNILSEEERKKILQSIGHLEFTPSVYEKDENVFYCFTAFEGESNTTTGLKSLMRLEPNAVKHERSCGLFTTKLYVVSGQSKITAENNKKSSVVDIGTQITIPKHTRYAVENNSVETVYFLCITDLRVCMVCIEMFNRIQVNIHWLLDQQISCPGVRFSSNQSDLSLRIKLFNSFAVTSKLRPKFPLNFYEHFYFEKQFNCFTVKELFQMLSDEELVIELLNESNLIICKYESNALQFLYPRPQLRPKYSQSSRSLLMDCSLLKIAPKLEFRIINTIIFEEYDRNSDKSESNQSMSGSIESD